VAKCNINFNTVSGDDISQTRPQVKGATPQQVAANENVNVGDVKTYVQNVLSKSAFTQTRNSRYVEFTLAGLPNNQARIQDGLDSLSVQVGENGVFTNYAFSDKLIKAQEALEIRRLRSAVTNYNHLPRRYMSLLEGSSTQTTQFIQPT
jgi:multidrug efflux pump subunit AcrB